MVGISNNSRTRCDGSKLNESEIDDGEIDGDEINNETGKKYQKMSKSKKTLGRTFLPLELG